MHRCTVGLVLLLAASPLAAQMRAPAAAAAATITAADVSRRIGIIADDSMLGRDTPSRGLELTAAYIAEQFREFGLKPAGDRGTWFQRYPISKRKLDLARSRVLFTAGGKSVSARLDQSARYNQGNIPEQPITGPAILVGGRVEPDDVDKMALQGKIVIYVSDYSVPIPQNAAQVGRAIRLAAPKAVIQLSNLDSASFVGRVPRQAQERVGIDLQMVSPPFIEVSEAVLPTVLRAARVTTSEVRKAGGPVVRELPRLTVRVELEDSVLSALTAPNTVGIVEGSDPALKQEYLVYSAHMDHIGITPGKTDSINNGADDDASGTAGLVELAEAFSRPDVKPKRSIVFLAVSGEEKGLWGSRYYSEHPTVPLEKIVANINIDMIGRNWEDTIVAIGKEHSDLGATLNRVNAAHPELRMKAVDDRWPEERFYFRSDHYNFARKGIPILFFFNGVHEDYHEVSDSPEKIGSEKEARILQLLFYLGLDVANARKRPEWREESRAEIVED